ncbi:transglutaminase family protein [Synechococcus elongatus IITB4]|uniref:transglutaminase family protein n=1 Tax=Synechococcus elongatus TaxID=32046 RepID=UPI0030D62C59
MGSAAEHWPAIAALGDRVEAALQAAGVDLWMGGEPTFVAADQLEDPQWRTAALGPEKYQLGQQLRDRLVTTFKLPHPLLIEGTGKWYPGEAAPRWSLGAYWRRDGQPLWTGDPLTMRSGTVAIASAEKFVQTLQQILQLPDVAPWRVHQEAAVVLPLLPIRKANQPAWATCTWSSVSGTDLVPLEGETPLGLRLPLQQLGEVDLPYEPDDSTDLDEWQPDTAVLAPPNSLKLAVIVREVQQQLRVFLPPLISAPAYLHLLQAIAQTSQRLQQPVQLEGYPPPRHPGLMGLQVTPDPGVLEVNIHPVGDWRSLVDQTKSLYQEAQTLGLTARRYQFNGLPTDTGGGAHITLGGRSPETSPLLRRPDLLRSLISYWQHHPSLSYGFAGWFIGPTCQAPRVDEGRPEVLYELELAFEQLQTSAEPAAIDGLLGHLLADVSGNTHRAEFCLDKLWPSQIPTQQWGVLELRAFAMPPDAAERLLQLLLVRALVAWFWGSPFQAPLRRWGTQLHDRFLSPEAIQADFQAVLADLAEAGFVFNPAWFDSHFADRFPCLGNLELTPDWSLELQRGLEPWPVLADDVNEGGTSRRVDASLERLQIRVQGPADRLQSLEIVCNGWRIPWHWQSHNQAIAIVRFRARPRLGTVPLAAIAPQVPLEIQLFEAQQGLGGCRYWPEAPGGGLYDQLPTTTAEAAQRCRDRFQALPAVAWQDWPHLAMAAEFPETADLRRAQSY